MVDISQVTEHVYVGSRIGSTHADELKFMKFDLIISMMGEMRPDTIYSLPPFSSLWIPSYDTFFTPIPIKMLMTGIDAALPVIRAGGKVLIFCMQGRRRSIIMAAAILISEGHPADEAVELLIKARKVADPRRWYVRSQIWGFERYWKLMHADVPPVPGRTHP